MQNFITGLVLPTVAKNAGVENQEQTAGVKNAGVILLPRKLSLKKTLLIKSVKQVFDVSH